MLARGILGSGWTRSVSFQPFPNSSGWWWLISSVFLIRISCHKTTHVNGYYGAWPGWAVSISVLPLTAFFSRISVVKDEDLWGSISLEYSPHPPEKLFKGRRALLHSPDHLQTLWTMDAPEFLFSLLRYCIMTQETLSIAGRRTPSRFWNWALV